MARKTKYRFWREGDWRLWVLTGRWNPALWGEVRRQMRDRVPGDHPVTHRFSFPAGATGVQFYLKVYGRSDLLGRIKDLMRDSKAFRALKQSEALAESGFSVPLPVAAGEERELGVLKRAFILTLGIDGLLLPHHIRDHYFPPLEPRRLREKRKYLRQFAEEIRRLHDSGFVHGDLVPYNILVSQEGGTVRFFYLDNDRTRRYPRWLPQALWKRNLVQLNRFVLPGISLQDRMRFLRSYLGKRAWGATERRLVRWLEEKTRKRWADFAPAAKSVSFRRLMQWGGPFSKNTQE